MNLTTSEQPISAVGADAGRPELLQKILVVVDPAAHEQVGLDKAIRIAECCRSSLELYVCDVEQGPPESWAGASRADEYRELTRQRQLGELRILASSLKARGLEVSTVCEWHAPLEQGIGHHVIRTRPDLVVKEYHRHGALGHGSLSNSDWNLIRQIPVPLLLVQSRPWHPLPRIAVAVDPCHASGRPGSFDQTSMEWGRSLGNKLDAALDFLHVLQTPPHLPGEPVSPEQRARAHALARNAVAQLAKGTDAAVHFAEGPLAEGLVRLVKARGPDVLVVGAVARPRWIHSAASGTAAQILERIDCDVLVIKPSGFVSPLLVTDE